MTICGSKSGGGSIGIDNEYEGPVDTWELGPIAYRLRSKISLIPYFLFSREPRLYKRMCPSVGPSVGNAFARRAEANRRTTYFVHTNLFNRLRVTELLTF